MSRPAPIRTPLVLLVLGLRLAGCGAGEGSGSGSGSAPAAETRVVLPATEILDPASIPTVPRRAKRLLLFAIDGATWQVADPLLAEGRLPNLAGLIARGARADLTTLEPTVSPAIWTTIATGKLPRDHGILGFEGVPGRTMTTLPNSRMRRVKTYWEILADLGFTTGTVGWWASWPAEELGEGSFLVSDRVPYTRMEAAVARASLTARDTYPEEVLDVVAPLVERPNEIDPEAVRRFLGFDREGVERLLQADYRMGSFLPEFKFVYQSDLSTLKMALHLLRANPVDVGAVYFTGIDTVSHLYWHFTYPDRFRHLGVGEDEIRRYGAVIPLYYELMDRYLGRLLDVVGEDATVIVVSDHGFGGTGNLPWSGGHGRLTPGAPIAPPGILILSGPGIAGGPKRLDRAHVLDVVPTILHLLGLPAAEDMLGRVLVEALAPGVPSPAPRIETYERIGSVRAPGAIPEDPVGDAQRLERLRALGYIQ